MNLGFQIEIETGLSPGEDIAARNAADSFIKVINENDGLWNHMTAGGRKSYYRRNAYGCPIDAFQEDKNGLVFRRMSKNRRLFGIIRKDHIEILDGNNLENHCKCPGCLNHIKFRLKERPNTYVYHTQGVIKG